MIAYLRELFPSDGPVTDKTSLAIAGGEGGARLTHQFVRGDGPRRPADRAAIAVATTCITFARLGRGSCRVSVHARQHARVGRRERVA